MDTLNKKQRLKEKEICETMLKRPGLYDYKFNALWNKKNCDIGGRLANRLVKGKVTVEQFIYSDSFTGKLPTKARLNKGGLNYNRIRSGKTAQMLQGFIQSVRCGDKSIVVGREFVIISRKEYNKLKKDGEG